MRSSTPWIGVSANSASSSPSWPGEKTGPSSAASRDEAWRHPTVAESVSARVGAILWPTGRSSAWNHVQFMALEPEGKERVLDHIQASILKWEDSLQQGALDGLSVARRQVLCDRLDATSASFRSRLLKQTEQPPASRQRESLTSVGTARNALRPKGPSGYHGV